MATRATATSEPISSRTVQFSTGRGKPTVAYRLWLGADSWWRWEALGHGDLAPTEELAGYAARQFIRDGVATLS